MQIDKQKTPSMCWLGCQVNVVLTYNSTERCFGQRQYSEVREPQSQYFRCLDVLHSGCASIHCCTERFTWRVHLLRASVEMAATFTVGEQIGRGQYGQVYRATFEGSQVAIKRILIDGGGHEYEGMKKMDHPNVLKLLHLEDKDPFRLRLFSRISFRISVHFFKLKFENAGTWSSSCVLVHCPISCPESTKITYL